MGLSDEERYDGLLYVTEKIVNLGSKCPDVEMFTSKLWHALLGMENCNSHWILGSPSSHRVEEYGQFNPWSRAICNSIKDRIKEDEKKDDNDVFHYIFTFEHLLKKQHMQPWAFEGKCSDIYEIYQWSEQIIYYLRRYNDDFLKKYSEYDRLISSIQGVCFTYFKDCHCFATAYIVICIMKIIYGEFYPYRKEKWDEVTKWLVEHHVHFDLDRCMEMTIKELSEIHKSLVADHSIKNRMLMIGRMLLRRLHNYRTYEFVKKYISKAMFERAKKLYNDHNKSDEEPNNPLNLYR